MPFQIDGRGGYDSFALTSRPTGVMLLTRRQPFYPSAAHDKFFSICTAFGGYTKFGIAPDIADLQSALENMGAASFTDEEPSQKQEISITVHLDNETHPTVQIDLYRYDGEQCLAVLDGTPTSLVPRDMVVDLVEAVNAIVL